MTMIWISAMPLLTTLAALVIIVHCVEEDLETEYRHDIRPRLLDTGTSNYDQAWRAIEEEPEVHKPRQTENRDDNMTDIAPKRRRLGRKRKRRLQAISTEEMTPLEGPAYPDEPPRPYYDVDYDAARQTTEMPKRRRKKPETRPVRWKDDEVTIVERPLRKNGGRRKKRPSLDTLSELSEFRLITDINQEETREPDPNPHKSIAEKVFGHTREINEHRAQYITNHHMSKAIADQDETEQLSEEHITADKSLSEFSLELVSQPKLEMDRASENYESRIHIPKVSLPEMTETEIHELENQKPILQDKSQNITREPEKKKETAEDNEKEEATQQADINQPGKLSLKDILKRSNGTSLSEILQQHNLSLSDLLHGKEHAVSVLKHKNQLEIFSEDKVTEASLKESSTEQILINSETKYATEPVTEYYTTTETIQTESETETTQTTAKPFKHNVPKLSTNRYLIGLRKKLRMRPVLNTALNTTNTFKGQASRDIIAMNSRKYSNFRRNRTKSKLWKDIIPSMTQNNTNDENNNKTTNNQKILVIVPDETTVASEISYQNSSCEDPQIKTDIKLDDINMDVTESLVTESVTERITEKSITEKTIGVVTMARPTAISSGLRLQALNNRLKRKRLKNKQSTTEPPQDDLIKHLFGMTNLVSSSEFIARTQEPRTTEEESTDLTTLPDFLTTEKTQRTNGHVRITATPTTTPKSIIETTTEETAKTEIEEIFNDTKTSAKLSRILKERNMTLNELVELRERGSSHVHLADIFHNASKEPNPAEPFLSKSLLEPISKETYPLRAILEANLHDPNGKVTTIDSNTMDNINIPVVMDFGNNVNENAENMGIMSLFNNLTKNITQSKTSTDHESRNLTVPEVPTTIANRNQTDRESRLLEDIKDDIVTWNEIFSMMGRNHNDEINEASSNPPLKKITIEDADGDGLIVLEDLQHLADLDSNIASIAKEKLDVKSNAVEKGANIPDKISNHTKSVTVATACIAGLAMVLFLLTYATFKWRRQRSLTRDHNFRDERIPTPVFENRKCHKNNSSTRSMSPMLQTSNIYTLNTLDSQNGKETPDYMWDSLRKPFQ